MLSAHVPRRSHGPIVRPLLVKPVVPLFEIDHLVCDAFDTVLVENLVYGSRQPFRVGVRQTLVVHEEDSRVIYPFV